ncbi:hypothetical protein Tco_0761756 [Tanacetum coccineum]
MSSDSASSEVTYMSISMHGDLLAWAVDFFILQEPDSPEAAPASPDYVPGPEEPEQPYAVADSPIALSIGYVADSDPEEDSKDGPVDYPADGSDEDNDDSFDDDKEDEEAEEEEEHLAPTDSVVAPVADHVPSSEETKPFQTDESAATQPSPPACRTTARISIRPEAPILLPTDTSSSYSVMSSASSTVTYTSVDTDSEPGRAFWPANEELSNGGLEDLQAHDPDYVPGPEEPEQAPLSPDYVPGPEYPEYLAPSDEEVPMEDQPYDPEEDSEDGPVDYPADGGDDDDDDSSDDDKEDEEASEEEEVFKEEKAEEEEEHLAPVDSVVAPVADHVPSYEETKPFETDESAATPPSPPACRTTARMSIRPEAPERLARCLAAPALPSSPLPRLPHPYGSPNHVRAPPGFKAAMGRLRASSPFPPPVPATLPLPSPPLPPLPSSPLPPLPDSLCIPPVDRREDIPEAELPPHKRLCLTTPASRYEVGEILTAVPRPTGGRTHSEIYAVIDDTQDLTELRIYQTVETWDKGHMFGTAGSPYDLQDSLIASSDCHRFHHSRTIWRCSLREIRALSYRAASSDAPKGTVK